MSIYLYTDEHSPYLVMFPLKHILFHPHDSYLAYNQKHYELHILERDYHRDIDIGF